MHLVNSSVTSILPLATSISTSTATPTVGMSTSMLASPITAYSHLESLLLFQALRNQGVQSISFNRISDQLKSVPLLRDDPSYDSGRLSPDALRELYLSLLKEEVKHDLEQQLLSTQRGLVNGDASPASRKRKAPSPSLPTVHEAAQHAHLIPQLVTRLYARYRENSLLKIKGYESRYVETERHVKEIENGQWDERLQREDMLKLQRAASQTHSSRPSPKPSSTAHTQPLVARADLPKPSSASASPDLSKPPEGNLVAVPKRYSQAKIDAVINHGPETHDSTSGHRTTSSNTKLPPFSEMASQSPHYSMPAQGHHPVQPVPPGAQGHVYGQTPPAAHHSPYAPHHAHHRPGSISSSQLQQSLSRPSSSPRPILPPPPGMPMSPHASAQPSNSPVQHQYSPQAPPQQHFPQPQQQRVPSGPPQQGGYSAPPVPPHTPGYYPPQPQYQDRRTSHVPPQPQTPIYSHHQPPNLQPHPGQLQKSGYSQPYPQDQPRPILPQQPRTLQAQVHSQGPALYPQPSYHAPATAPRQPPAQNRMVADVISLLATPPRRKVRPLWKEKFQPSPLAPSGEKPRPVAEPLSPRKERKSPVRTTRAGGGRVPSIDESHAAEPAPKTRTSKRKSTARDRSPGGNSVVSSAADESLRGPIRSQSVSTAAGAHATSDERPSSRNGVKPEPSTPAENADSAEAPASGPLTRKRRGTMQSHPLPPSKRKRHESPAADDETDSTPPPRGNTVIATRNFNKMTSALMNDILSHKHASYFTGPVRDKDAPGYSDIVVHPQNLKAIKSAMTAGNQAVKAAASLLDLPSDASGASSGTVELEKSLDLMPPKAIVNGAQLEKELMRMFANAYMFNPGEDGMALTTKEMFLDVEQKISEWRGAERSVGGDEEEEVKGKRRKL